MFTREIATLALLFAGVVVPMGGAAGQSSVAPSQSPGGEASAGVAPASRWHQPKSGWLYVLDVNPEQPDNGNVLLVDPQTGSIEGSAPVGYAAEMALSPDRGRLYFAAMTDLGDVLFALDTATGHSMLLTRLPYRWRGTRPSLTPKIAASSDGRWLYALKLNMLFQEVPGARRKRQADIYTLAAYDTKQSTLLTKEAHLPGCVSAVLVPVPGKAQVQVFCNGTNVAYLVDASEKGLQSAAASGSFPRGDELRPAYSAARALPGGSSLVVMQDGRLIKFDPGMWAVRQTVTLLEPVTPRAPQATDRWVLPTPIPLSPDGRTVYIAMSTFELRSHWMADEIWALDVATLGMIKILRPHVPFQALEISADGGELYALNEEARTLTVIDTDSGAVIRSFAGIGEGPVMAIRAR